MKWDDMRPDKKKQWDKKKRDDEDRWIEIIWDNMRLEMKQKTRYIRQEEIKQYEGRKN